MTQQLSATVYADFLFNEGESVTVVGFDGLPTFFIDSENRTEYTVSITAYDRSRKLSQPFDYSTLKDGDKTDSKGDPIYKDISATEISNKIAAQCGFLGASGTTELLVGNVTASTYKGASCNSIMEALAGASGCFVQSGSDNSLCYHRIGVETSAASCSNHSAIIEYPTNSYTRLIVTGDSSNVYDNGSGAPANIIELSNTLITQGIAQSLATRLFEGGAYTYKPLSFSAVLEGNIDPYGTAIVGDKSYTVTNISINLCADGAVASLSTPQMPESSSVYNDLLTRAINQRIAANRIYGCTEITDQGLKFVSAIENSENSDESSKTEYGFEMAGEGVARFAGALLNGMLPTAVKIAEDGKSLRANYNGKIFEYAITEDNDGNIIPTTSEVSGDG